MRPAQNPAASPGMLCGLPMAAADFETVEFPVDLQWLGRPPLSLQRGLRGHVVAVLFWRLGCVHSRHALADLAALQQEFAARPFAVVALHVPVSAAERDPERLQRALTGLPAPVTVAVDPQRQAFLAFGAAAFPALVLIDATSAIVFRGRGEPNLLRVRQAVQALLDDAHRRGQLASVPFAPVPLPQPASTGPTQLRQPVGLCVDPSGAVWVAERGAHRLLRFDPASGRVLAVVGSGVAGDRDGPGATASFRSPMGLVCAEGQLLVADTGNHVLRAVDVDSLQVRTVLGTGRRSTDRFGGGFGTLQGLCSPTALLAHDGTVYVAQTGAHQVWQFDRDTESASSWLGTGAPVLRDGGEEAGFAQPLGLAAAGNSLWVADAGNGALRHVDLAHTFVRTVQQGLSWPVAIAVHGDAVIVAEGERPAVLRVPVAGGEPLVLATAQHGLVEPSGLLVAGDLLWIADAGAGCLWQIDLALPSAPLVPFALHEVPGVPSPVAPPWLACTLPTVRLRPFCDVTLRLRLPPPDDGVFDESQPVQVHLVAEAEPVLAVDCHRTVRLEGGCVVVDQVPVAAEGTGPVRVLVAATLRRGPRAEPEPVSFRFVMQVEVVGDGELDVSVDV